MAKFLDWLAQYTVNYFPTHDKARIQRALHTGRWFFGMNEYREWIAAEENGRRNLECVGIPGAGKTTLASSVVETIQESIVSLETDNSALVLFAYFRHDTQATQTIVHVLASLLHQTIRRTNKLSPGMIELYTDYSPNKDHALAPDRLTKVLRSELCVFKTYIIVDALDEFCIKDYSLSHPLVIQLQLLNAKLMITSRFPVGFAPNTYSTIKILAHADDIRLFVQEHMTGHLAGIVASKPDLLDEIANAIIEKSRGMFVIARLLINCLPDSLTVNEIRVALRDLTSTQNLKDVYKLIMRRLRDQKSRLVQVGISALLWVYFAKERLTIKELRHAVSFQPGTKTLSECDLIGADRILSACAGLITTVSDDNGEGEHSLDDERMCQFSHFTAKEFFDDFWKDYFPEGERQITETCRAYIAAALSAIPPEATEHFIHSEPEDDRDEWQQFRTSKFALLVYAATFWGAHCMAIDEMLDFDAGTSVFRHLISPYMANSSWEGTRISPTVAMPPMHYWILYFARFGMLEHLQKYAGPSGVAFPHHDDHAHEVFVDYNDVWDRDEWTALHFSALYGHSEVVEFVLNNGTDANQLNLEGQSPLHFAVQAGSSGLNAVQLLLKHGAIVDQPDGWNRAPISLAIDSFHTSNQPSPDIIHLLLQHDIDIFREDKEGMTPLSRARKSENPEITQLLDKYSRNHPAEPRICEEHVFGGHFNSLNCRSQHKSRLEPELPMQIVSIVSSKKSPSPCTSAPDSLQAVNAESPTTMVPNTRAERSSTPGRHALHCKTDHSVGLLKGIFSRKGRQE